MLRVFLAFVVLGTIPSAWAADWPQFLGPKRDNSSPETVAAWSGELKPIWSVPVGEAHSSPVVANGVVYAFFEPKGKNADALAAYDAKTGKKLWESSYDRDEFSPPFGNGPRGTPTVSGGKIYTLGGTGVLACWDAKSGRVEWKVDTLKQFNVENLVFGISGSPLVAQNLVFVNVGAKDAGLVAFNTHDGSVKWKSTSDGASYSSPMTMGEGPNQTVVFLTKQNLIAVDPQTGSLKWTQPFRDNLQESATMPVVAGEMIIGSSVTLGSIALKPNATDKPEVVWRKRDLNCYFSTPAVVGQDLYMFNGVLSISPTINLRCVEAATGKILWSHPKVGKYHAALIRMADNKLLMLDDAGTLTLIEPNAEKFKPLATAKVCGPTWAHPALADGVLYLRDEKNLLALPLPGGKPAGE